MGRKITCFQIQLCGSSLAVGSHWSTGGCPKLQTRGGEEERSTELATTKLVRFPNPRLELGMFYNSLKTGKCYFTGFRGFNLPYIYEKAQSSRSEESRALTTTRLAAMQSLHCVPAAVSNLRNQFSLSHVPNQICCIFCKQDLKHRP